MARGAAVSDENDVVFVSFSLPLSDRGNLQRMARRLGCANVEILLAELVKIGYRTMEERFEPEPHLLSLRARAKLRARE